VSDKSALRAGWARFVVPPLVVARTITSDIGVYGFSQATQPAPTILGIPGAHLNNPFPNLLLPPGNSLGRYTQLGDSVAWDTPDFRTGVNDRLNVSFQYALPGRFIAETTYFVNRGYDHPYNKRLNMMDPQLLYTHKSLVEQPVPNPFYQYGTPESFPGPLRNYPYLPATYLLKPYPQYVDLTQRNTQGIDNRYHALQLSLRKDFSQGYQLLWNYNYGRQNTGVFFNDLDEYANLFTMMPGTDGRHRMNFAGTFDLPFGKGRRYATNASTLVDAFIGGWTASPLYTYSSGQFLRFNPALVTGDPHIENPSRELYFDPTVFKMLPPYTPRTNPWQYEGIIGSTNWNIDLSVGKYFQITERLKAEFRFEAYNLTNSFVPGLPDMTVGSPLFGKSTTQANLGRQMQYTLRLHF
jgi:hypothetical protein